MSAPLSHRQLAMYMTAKELKEGVTSSADPHRGLDNLWAYKLEESKTGAIRNARYTPTRNRGTNNLYSSIKEKGVQRPVEIQHNKGDKHTPKGMSIVEGHHRVAAAYDINPHMLVPVEEYKYSE